MADAADQVAVAAAKAVAVAARDAAVVAVKAVVDEAVADQAAAEVPVGATRNAVTAVAIKSRAKAGPS